MNLLEKIDKIIRRFAQTVFTNNNDVIFSRSLGIVVCIMLYIFLVSDSIGTSIVVGAFLSVCVFYFMIFRLIDVHQKDYIELKNRIRELEQQLNQQEVNN